MGPLRQFLIGAGVVTAATVALALPAHAHVSVGADQPRPGATKVNLGFEAAAESTTAGIVKVRVTLPDGIAADKVRLTTAPPGWRLRERATGYDLSGPALAVGEHLRYTIQVARLPSGEERLAFPTIQEYDDGRVDEWVELGSHEGGEHKAATGSHPAPVLELTAAGAGSTISDQAAGTRVVPTVGVSAEDSRSRLPLALLIAGALVTAGIAAFFWRRDRRYTR